MLISLMSFSAMAAASKKEVAPPPPNPEEIWLSPIRIRLETESIYPKSGTVVLKISLQADSFEDVCPLVPKIVDSLTLKLNEELQTPNILQGRTKANTALELTKFAKTKFDLRNKIYSIELYPSLPKFDKDSRDFYNKCNALPAKVIR